MSAMRFSLSSCSFVVIDCTNIEDNQPSPAMTHIMSLIMHCNFLSSRVHTDNAYFYMSYTGGIQIVCG